MKKKQEKLIVEIEYVLSHTAKTVKGELVGHLLFCDILPTILITVDDDDMMIALESIVSIRAFGASKYPAVPFQYPDPGIDAQ